MLSDTQALRRQRPAAHRCCHCAGARCLPDQAWQGGLGPARSCTAAAAAACGGLQHPCAGRSRAASLSSSPASEGTKCPTKGAQRPGVDRHSPSPCLCRALQAWLDNGSAVMLAPVQVSRHAQSRVHAQASLLLVLAALSHAMLQRTPAAVQTRRPARQPAAKRKREGTPVSASAVPHEPPTSTVKSQAALEVLQASCRVWQHPAPVSTKRLGQAALHTSNPSWTPAATCSPCHATPLCWLPALGASPQALQLVVMLQVSSSAITATAPPVRRSSEPAAPPARAALTQLAASPQAPAAAASAAAAADASTAAAAADAWKAAAAAEAGADAAVQQPAQLQACPSPASDEDDFSDTDLDIFDGALPASGLVPGEPLDELLLPSGLVPGEPLDELMLPSGPMPGLPGHPPGSAAQHGSPAAPAQDADAACAAADAAPELELASDDLPRQPPAHQSPQELHSSAMQPVQLRALQLAAGNPAPPGPQPRPGQPQEPKLAGDPDPHQPGKSAGRPPDADAAEPDAPAAAGTPVPASKPEAIAPGKQPDAEALPGTPAASSLQGAAAPAAATAGSPALGPDPPDPPQATPLVVPHAPAQPGSLAGAQSAAEQALTPQPPAQTRLPSQAEEMSQHQPPQPATGSLPQQRSASPPQAAPGQPPQSSSRPLQELQAAQPGHCPHVQTERVSMPSCDGDGQQQQQHLPPASLDVLDAAQQPAHDEQRPGPGPSPGADPPCDGGPAAAAALDIVQQDAQARCEQQQQQQQQQQQPAALQDSQTRQQPSAPLVPVAPSQPACQERPPLAEVVLPAAQPAADAGATPAGASTRAYICAACKAGPEGRKHQPAHAQSVRHRVHSRLLRHCAWLHDRTVAWAAAQLLKAAQAVHSSHACTAAALIRVDSEA